MATLSLLNPKHLIEENEKENSQILLGLTINSNCNNELGYIPQPPACKTTEVCQTIQCRPLEEVGIQLGEINKIQPPTLLGTGGMNQVYDISYDDQQLVLRLTKIGDPNTVENESVGLLYQTKLSKSKKEGGLGCPYIAKVYDFGKYEGNVQFHTPRTGVYGILEKLPMDLFERVQTEENIFTEDDIKSMTKQLLMALSCMHNNNIYHLDIKPENIMMCDKGNKNIKLIDFGLCYTYEKHLEMPLNSKGTVQYFSPGFNFRYHKEELNKELTNEILRRPYPIDDLWSLAVSICLITGIEILENSKLKIPFFVNNRSKEIVEKKQQNNISCVLKFSNEFYQQNKKPDDSFTVGDVVYSKECIHFLKRIFDTMNSENEKPNNTFTTLTADELLQDPWFQESKGGKSKRKRRHKNKTKRKLSKRKTKSKK